MGMIAHAIRGRTLAVGLVLAAAAVVATLVVALPRSPTFWTWRYRDDFWRLGARMENERQPAMAEVVALCRLATVAARSPDPKVRCDAGSALTFCLTRAHVELPAREVREARVALVDLLADQVVVGVPQLRICDLTFGQLPDRGDFNVPNASREELDARCAAARARLAKELSGQ